VFKLIKRTVATLLVIYLALFGFTKVIRYPEPTATIKLGFAPASKTPYLMPAHYIEPADQRIPWTTGTAKLPEVVNLGGTEVSLDKFFTESKTNAFIVIKNGKVVLEKYFNGKDQKTPFPSYSAAKTLTSFMIGQLIDQGKLKESDTFVSILPEYKAGTSFDQITIRDLLDMNSGIAAKDDYPTGPQGWGVAIAQMYASTDLKWWLSHNRKMTGTPGNDPVYKSINTQMLGMVVQKITGQSISKYFEKNVWQPIGAQDRAFWNVDHVGGIEKTFCCFNATARDYARIGQLLMNNGGAAIGGGNVISAKWMARLKEPVVTLDEWGYGAQIWHPYPGVMMLDGLHGQYVYVQQDVGVIIVKLSDYPTDGGVMSKKVADVMQQIANQI
jgi:CubicO group peptidase (beta-lactamase class C family)